MLTIIVTLFSLAASAMSYPSHLSTSLYNNYAFPYMSRTAWGASPPRSVTRLNLPVSYIVIHHTYIPRLCTTRDQCIRDMRSVQNTHMNTNGWDDIGYNFAVGGEGTVYEGRGWEAVGAHAVGYNAQSIGIALIGDFVAQLPPPTQMATTRQLIAVGVHLGYISPNYKLIGHREVSATECPGEALFREIQSWGSNAYPFSFVSRQAWNAAAPRSVVALSRPVAYVIIHHTYIPVLCTTREQCMCDMRSMQNSHQNTNGWADIGYNFAVGGEGSVYEGRGWEAVGSHAAGYNSEGIGIALIGDFVSRLPPAIQMATTKQLIAVGVQLGHISPNYKLIGHREVSATECPGQSLFNEIQSWDNYWPESENGNGNGSLQNNQVSIVNRATWGARPARSVSRLNTPVSLVVIHHTAVPAICMTRDQCMRDMRSMQNTHMNVNGWVDIGYNFAVGGEGSVFEGRGWQAVGAHASGYNSQSIGIVLIGDFASRLPPAVQMSAAQRLITLGVQLGHIRANYRLVGHRQVGSTQCPGTALFKQIQSWNNFSPNA